MIAAPRQHVRVELDSRAYDIEIGRGLISELGQRVEALAQGSRVIVVTDAHVAALHLQTALNSLAAAGVPATTVVLPAGEATKSFRALEDVCDAIIAARLERRDLVVALGGGVIGDLTGFAAAIVRRGLRFVQVPTTLLAAVDSSVGGKTAINAGAGKNLVGAFHQPVRVLADVDCLDSLPPRELRAGYAEVVKYGVLGDVGFFEWLEHHGPALLAGDAASRTHAVAASVHAKAAIVAEDERETGRRALLNLGHTFGHALEAATGFGSRLLHGEAVAIGMAMALATSERLLGCPADARRRLLAHGHATGLPMTPAGLGLARADAPSLLAAMTRDKKARDGAITLVLCRQLGEAVVLPDAPTATVREVLEDSLDQV
jgi:3-dehydroquinate synthase